MSFLMDFLATYWVLCRPGPISSVSYPLGQYLWVRQKLVKSGHFAALCWPSLESIRVVNLRVSSRLSGQVEIGEEQYGELHCLPPLLWKGTLCVLAL
jgi:hypothetical protein